MGYYKLLVVDDLEKNLQLIKNQITDEQIEIITSNSGVNAVHMAKTILPDLVLLDIAMPEMDGFEVCELLKLEETTREIPIIFLTAKNESADIVKGFAVGAVDYITKPINKQELLSRVYTHLELKKSRDIIKDQNEKLELSNKRILEHSKMVESLNNQLYEQNKQLLSLNITKDKLFQVISHDLKNPLGNIKNFIQSFREGVMAGDMESCASACDVLEEAANSSVQMLEDLLLWARAQTGKLDVKFSRVQINSLLEKQLDYCRVLSEQKEIQVETSMDSKLFAHADPDMLGIVLRNLLTNAIKFTNPNGLIRVGLAYMEKRGLKNMLQITVADNGIGMSAELLEQLFQSPINQSRYGTNGEKGTGLGLALCKELLDQQRGSISVSSRPGEGSIFEVLLPTDAEEDFGAEHETSTK